MEALLQFEGKRMSRPVRARGLKPIEIGHANNVIESRPVRARGLKLVARALHHLRTEVAPRTGAWIET